MAKDSYRSLLSSDEFVISCGTVPLDITHKKVLLVRERKTNEFLLSKGRKDMGEDLQATAVRETTEETGYAATILPLKTATRATNDHGEPIARTERKSGDILKTIYWFASSVDSQGAHQKDTQQEGEDFESVWMNPGEAIERLTYHDDREVARMVIDAAFGS
ncbi:NUDIX domain-containing protein [Aureobasidium pullulans]|uniref:NUDIX domain-containing protein n=1 Tax=Aureobasidium pullulans TaxID=5580 RepID=A0A4S9WPN4_AURPU|nr:NUDIX domain-containing protein [Aureobasidium pullulans]